MTTEYTGELPPPPPWTFGPSGKHKSSLTEEFERYARAAVAHVLAQKTGDVKRYKENWGSHYLGEDANGEWVRFADVAAALAQSRQRVEELEAELAQARAGHSNSVGTTVAMPGSGGGFTMCAFHSADVPVGTKLYTHPAPQQGQVPEGWQPIETAPRHGLIDILMPNGVRWAGVYYDRICDEWRHVTQFGNLLAVKRGHPTHWMPIPAAPAQGEKE